jgi:hypothetical protein
MKRLILAACALTLAGAPLSALADPGGGKGGPKGHPHGAPPGQMKKHWNKGERLPSVYITERYYVEPARYHLPPPPYGYRYVLVEDRIYVAQTTTGAILDVISALVR